MESFENLVQRLYTGILADISMTIPGLQKDLERDESRLQSCIEARGLSFVTIDLPTYGKHFDMCLSKGLLTRSSLPFMRGFKRGTPIPRLFRGLMSRVFDTNGVLRLDADVASIRFLRQLYYAAKKLNMECTDVRIWKQVQNFFDVEAQVRCGSREWDYDDPEWPGKDSLYFGDDHPDHHDLQGTFSFLEERAPLARMTAVTLQGVADIISAEIGLFDPIEWKTKHGPGAVSDMKVGRASKYDFPTWPEKLARVFPLDVFAFGNYGLWADSVATGETVNRFSPNEAPSILIAVPKTQKGPRLIAKEPTSHQWCQQALKDFFVERLKHTSVAPVVHFDDQSYNQRAAQQASITGEHRTIDLSEASDRVTLYCVERLFRNNHSVLSAIHATRTRYIEQTICRKQPKFHKLRKLSCMGSAVTFPTESILFAVMAITAVLVVRSMPATTRNIRQVAGEVLVFGDDIIIPNDAGDCLAEILHYLDLKVNPDKTFGSGNFRESCGMDAFKGHDVTPVYIMDLPQRSRPESVVSFVESHNNFVKKGYVETARILKWASKRNIPKGIANVDTDSGDFGFASPFGVDNSHLRKRLNIFLQRVEHLTTIPRGTVRKVADRGSSSLLQYFTERPAPHDKWVAGYVPSAHSLYWRKVWKAV